MQPGDRAILRGTDEPLEVLAVVDAAGTLLVRVGDEEFCVARDDVSTLAERHACCGAC